MKNNLFKFLVFTAFVPSSLAATTNGQQIKSKASANTAETSALLYRITGKDLKKPSYLFGTIHIICQPDMLPMGKLNGYLNQTDRLVLEIDMDDAGEMQTMQKALLIPGGKTFTEFLKPEQTAKIDEMLKSTLGASIEQVKSLRPMMLQIMMMSTPKVIGCNLPSSYEMTFLQTATQKKKTVEGLETVASQMEALDSQPLEKQARQLYEAALNPEKGFDDFKKLLATYKTQNSDALYDLIDAQIPAEDKAFQMRLVDTRNIAWIPKIEKMIAEKPSFIAVGGGHLGGKNGVIKLLKAKGYQVQAIKL
jgi:uncharacterized protein YbaP (TraB family)